MELLQSFFVEGSEEERRGLRAALCKSTARQRRKTIDFGLNCLFYVRKTESVQNLAAQEVSLQSDGSVCQVELSL